MAEETTEQIEEVEETRHKPKRERSPAYPGVDLGTAVDRARALYESERKNAAPISAILEHWGYSPGSGRGLVTLAALKQFGLLVDEGSGERRKARLTPRALRILLDAEEGSTERQLAISDAAMQPKIHRELWKKYESDLPSDATLRTYLGLERNFTDRAVHQFIPQFRRTIAFAGLEEPGEAPPPSEETLKDEIEEQDHHQPGAVEREPGRPPSDSERSLRTVRLPLSGTAWISIQGAFPLSEEAWTQMLAILEVMKPGLTATPEALAEERASDVAESEARQV